MTTASIDLQGTAHPVVDSDPHPAESHLNDVRTYVRALVRYWIDLANWTEHVSAGRYAVPVLATATGIIGAAVLGVNL